MQVSFSKYFKSRFVNAFKERQTIWFVGLIFVLHFIIWFFDTTLSYFFLITIPSIFACINIVKYLIKGIKSNEWNTTYIVIALLFLVLTTKFIFIYYNFLFHLLVIISGFIMIVLKKNQVNKLLDRLTFLVVINLVVLLIPSILWFHYTLPEDVKVWTDNIKWTDFQGTRPSNAKKYGAQISTEIYWKYNRCYNTPRVLTITVMRKSNSWASALSAKYNSNNLLNHEKIHFDITEWTRREFKDSLDNADRLSKITMENIHEYFIELNNNRQDDYDNESEHGKNLEGQEKWNQKLNEFLNE